MQDGIIFWNQSKVQSDDQNRENPENIPGRSKIFIFYYFFDWMGGWIPYEKDEKNAEKIIQDSKSRKTGKCKVFRKLHRRQDRSWQISKVKLTKCYGIEQVEQIEEEEEQILLTNGIYSMQNHKNKSI